MVKKNFYAVVRGRTPGIYETWAQCEEQVRGFANSVFKSFVTRWEAEQFLLANRRLSASIPAAAATAADNYSDKEPTNKRLKTEAPASPASSTETVLGELQPGLTPIMSGGWDHHDGDATATATATATPVSAERKAKSKAKSSNVASATKSWVNQNLGRFGFGTANNVAAATAAASVTGAQIHAACDSTEAVPLAIRGQLYNGPDSMQRDEKDASAMTSRIRKQQENSARRSEGERKMKITAVLAVRLEAAIRASDAAAIDGSNSDETKVLANIQRMEGDIPQLGLHQSFFVGGVKIGWPYPVIMPPQRQMALHLVQALKRKLHVVLESPTGTGKSAAILCAVLSWQRYNAKLATKDEGRVKIIYCSRTHSQVTQMVASLKKTPYRPRMTVLGSRERLCIHREIKPRDGSQPSKPVNVNQSCQVRVKNSEKARKQINHYDDDFPPPELDSDGDGDTPDRERAKPTCSHYRQLTSTSLASMVQQKFAPNQAAVTCCSVGGEKTKLGAMDIEDLVAFGVNPHVHKGVAIYRQGGLGSFGAKLEHSKTREGCTVSTIVAGGAAANEGTLKARDRILKVNGKDMRNNSLASINEAFASSSDPVEVDVLREGATFSEIDNDTYSQHSACPYYLSRALTKHAELVFAPYNYILDPSIRKAMDIDLTGAVIVLDEAHNVEDTLRESGSFSMGEFELCELMVMLANKAGKSTTWDTRSGPDGGLMPHELAHELLLFVERIVLFMRDSRSTFEASPGKNGAAEAIREFHKFRTPDDNEFETNYFGPSGYGLKGKPVGCKPFFDKLSPTDIINGEQLMKHAQELLDKGNSGDDPTRESSDAEDRKASNLNDRLLELISKLCVAMSSPEHFFVSCAVRANGSLAFAAGDENEDTAPGFRKKPKHIPFAYPRNKDFPTREISACVQDQCKHGNGVHHALFCDGSTPRWESVLALQLLTPSILLRPIAEQCRTLVLASGSLAPLPSLCAELGLAPPKAETAPKVESTIPKTEETGGRLQMRPKPLEADHVINLAEQLRAISIGCFPDGSPLTVTYSNYSKSDFYPKLGNAIASVVEAIPRGGVLIFLPSYSFLRKCIKSWNPQASRWSSHDDEGVDSDIWFRFLRSKGTVVVEPTGSQADFEAAKERFSQSICRDGKAVLLAVFRGKMSEGISFNDDNARAVICVGLPLPNSFDRSITAKKSYNDEQRKLRHKTSLLPGSEWYSQQAYRAIAQALGRCIRHAGDYGTVVLMDSRHCDDGAPTDGLCRQHCNLPKWMRYSVRNLTMSTSRMPVPGNPPIYGGYAGLASELGEFFTSAKTFSDAVVAKFQKEFAQAQAPERHAQHSFNRTTGEWSSKPLPSLTVKKE